MKKHILLPIFLLLSTLTNAQFIAEYKASNGITYHLGDTIVLGKGSNPAGDFKSIYKLWISKRDAKSDSIAIEKERKCTGQKVMIDRIEYLIGAEPENMIFNIAFQSGANYTLKIEEGIRLNEAEAYLSNPNYQDVLYEALLHRGINKITYPQFVSTLLRRLNDFREGENTLHSEWKVKLQPLQYSMELEKACFYFFDSKKNMIDRKMDHYDDKGRSPFDRMTKLKIKYLYAGENIVSFRNGDSVYEICERWKASPGHWQNIIYKNFTNVGFGFREDKDAIVNDFARFK